MHFVKWMHIAYRSTFWSEHLEFAWNNTCVYEYNKFIYFADATHHVHWICVWSILVTHAQCWKKTKRPGHAQVNLCIRRHVCCTVAQFFCFIPYHISKSSACYVYKQYNVHAYACMYNIYKMYIYMYSQDQSSMKPHMKPLQDSIGLGCFGYESAAGCWWVWMSGSFEVGIHN